jgi:Holliday junction resolvasome RuvABC endonuclease subunit
MFQLFSKTNKNSNIGNSPDITPIEKSIVGLDMSLTSPGVAVLTGNIWQLYGFSKKKTKVTRSFNIRDNINLTLFPTIPKDHSDAKRYKFIIDFLINVIPQNSDIWIEAYAYPSRNKSGSNFKLHELGGHLKVRLEEHHSNHYQNVVASSWKKKVVGKGNATKLDVLHHVKEQEPFIDLLNILNLELTKKGDVPCPAQDIADAICIVKSQR